MKTYLLGFILFLFVVFASAHLSLLLPYVENWPYTGIVYGIVFLGALAVFFAAGRGLFRAEHPGKPMRIFVFPAVLLLAWLTVFWCFALRQSTEPLISYSFDNAVVVNKDRSSNHRYPRLALETADGRVILLEIPGQEEVWQRLNVGDRVSKIFRREEIRIDDIQDQGPQ